MNRKKAQFNLKRKKKDLQDGTLNFDKQLRKLDEFGYGLSASGLCKLVCISASCLKRWEKEELIFPVKMPMKNRTQRKFRYKDVLRAMTLKYLMSELGMRKFSGVRLLLEMTNLALAPKELEEADKSINNMRIDNYLMKVLDYDVEYIALSRLVNSSKSIGDIDDCLE